MWVEEVQGKKNQVLIFWSVSFSYLLNSLVAGSDPGSCVVGREIFGRQLSEILGADKWELVTVHQLFVDHHFLSGARLLHGIDPGGEEFG